MYWMKNNQTSAWNHRKVKVLNYITYISSLMLVWLINNEHNVDYITTYTARMLA